MDLEKLKLSINKNVFVVIESDGSRKSEYGVLQLIDGNDHIEVRKKGTAIISQIPFSSIITIQDEKGFFVYERYK